MTPLRFEQDESNGEVFWHIWDGDVRLGPIDSDGLAYLIKPIAAEQMRAVADFILDKAALK